MEWDLLALRIIHVLEWFVTFHNPIRLRLCSNRIQLVNYPRINGVRILIKMTNFLAIRSERCFEICSADSFKSFVRQKCFQFIQLKHHAIKEQYMSV